MNEYILVEFSLLYKRLTVIEQTLKEQIVQKYSEVYGQNAYNILYRYFKSLDIRIDNNSKSYEFIYNSSKNLYEKLTISINKLYLRQVLLLFSDYVFIKNKVRKSFWNKEIDVKSTEFQKNQKYLNELRNCVAHYNLRKYSIERKKLISALLYFENILNCNKTSVNKVIIEQIKKSKKLSINNILQIIFSINKSYFKDDKLLIPIFDDIAILNGYTFEALPQRWSIIRQKFNMEKSLNNSSKNIFDENDNQLKFEF